MIKTNVMRLLEQAGIPYEAKEYPFDENDLGGLHAARMLDMNPDQIFKTLVTQGASGGYYVFCIPVSCELELKKAARAAGEKRIAMIPMKQLLPLTGYLRGGCSPIGMKKSFPTFLDETAQLFDTIGISAGARGVQITAAPDALCAYIGAVYEDLTV